MSVNAKINDYQVVGDNTVHVIAEITSTSMTSVSKSEVQDALRQATKCKLNPVADTFVLREGGATRHIISGFMNLSSEVLTLPEGKTVEEATGFQAMSSNMFMDDNESLWELKADSGRHLIRSHVENNMIEMEQLMASMSSSAFSSLSSYDLKAVRDIQAERATIKGGDFITFMSKSGEVEQALVVASIVDTDRSHEMICVSNAGQIMVDRSNVVKFVRGEQFQDQLEQPEMQMTASGAGSNAVQKLVDYYTRLFDYNHDYRDKMLNIIRNHSYA